MGGTSNGSLPGLRVACGGTWRTYARVLLALLLCAGLRTAHAALDLAEVRQLLEAGRAADAYTLAQAHRAEQEGEPEFDYLYGLAALGSGAHGEGVFALERVLVAYPDDAQVRLALARGYFLLGEDTRAREEFAAVLASAPPADVAASVEQYLEALRRREQRYRPHWRAFVEVAGGHDDNVNSATSDGTFISPLLGVLSLLDDSQASASAFAYLAAGARYTRPFRPGLAWFVGGDFDRTWLEQHGEFETGMLNATAGLSLQRGDNEGSLGLVYQRYELDGARYRDFTGVTGEAWHRYGERTLAGVHLQALRLDYPDQPSRDADYYLLGLSLRHAFDAPWRPQLRLGVHAGSEQPREQNAITAALTERDLYGVQAGLDLALAPATRLHLDLLLQNSEYAAENLFFGVKREDDYLRASVGVDHRLAPRWWLTADLEYTDNDSNNVIYSYDRTVARVGLRYVYE